MFWGIALELSDYFPLVANMFQPSSNMLLGGGKPLSKALAIR